jgi:hypothetical protein
MYETGDRENEVQALTWALVDEQATDDQIRRLEEMLLEDGEARRVYITCMQMHADLRYLFGGKQPGLPPAVEEAIKAQEKKLSPRLPIVAPPPIVAHVPFVDGVR